MDMLISIIVCLGLLLNLLFQFREDKDERWKLIMYRPLNYAFTLLMMGYTIMIWTDGKYNFTHAIFKTTFGFIFAGVLVIYIALLIWERRKYS